MNLSTLALSCNMTFTAFTKRSLEGSYNSFARHYDRLFEELQKGKAAAIREYLEVSAIECDHVLELGCGTGILTEALYPVCGQIWGVDFSRDMLGIARNKLKKTSNVEFLQADFFYLNHPFNGKFDLIISMGIMPHIPPAVFADWLKQMKSLLTPKGHLITAISPLPWRMFIKKRPVNMALSVSDRILLKLYNGFMAMSRTEAQYWYCNTDLNKLFAQHGLQAKHVVAGDLVIVDAFAVSGNCNA